MRSIACMLLPILLCPCPSSANAQPLESISIVVDASGSMWGKIGQLAKFQAVVDAIKQSADDSVPPIEVGLTVFGHKTEDECSGGETIIAPQQFDKEKFSNELSRIKPRGRAPLMNTVKSAIELLRGKRSALLLITDGTDTCGQDPCKMIADLQKQAEEVSIDTIALDVKSSRDLEGLKCLSDAAKGKLRVVSTAEELNSVLREKMTDLAERAREPVVAQEEVVSVEQIQTETSTQGFVCDVPNTETSSNILSNYFFHVHK